MNPFKTAYLSALTLQHFHTRQILYLLKDRFFRRFGANLKYEESNIPMPMPFPVRFFCEDLPPFVSVNSDGSVSVDVFGVKFNWSEGEKWYFNPGDTLRPETLHYLEFLYHLLRGAETSNHRLSVKIALDFLKQHKKATHPYYSAYTTARRLIVLLLLHQFANEDEKRVLESAIAAHAHQITDHLEYHLSANHLFKCAKGLLFSGLFIRHPRASLWRYRASQILKNEIKRQILADGCHYERTFTYHCAVMEDLLDIETALATQRTFPELRHLAKTKLLKMADFLARCLHPDGMMPLFGDSAYGLAPTPQFLIKAVNDRFATTTKTPTEDVLELGASGYCGVRFPNGTFLIVNAGRMGAPDQPGHAHCDLFSFEFSICGERLIVDTGVYDYTSGARRDYARSTAAHNTVQIDNYEQALFWSVHRFATLALPRHTRTIFDKDKQVLYLLLTGNAYRKFGPTHLRRITCTPESLIVSDSMMPAAPFFVTYHFSPFCQPVTPNLIENKRVRIKIQTSEDVNWCHTPYFFRAGIEEKKLTCKIGRSHRDHERGDILVRFFLQ